MRKKRILFVSEASYLNTGYATYSREVLTRLQATGKYDIAEFSVYGTIDHKDRGSIPWKNYPNMPDQNLPEEVKAYSGDGTNQFGKWRFDRVCIDFKPDIVCTIRDWWMDAFIQHSPLRKYFKWIWMPTVDANPQNEEWIDSFASADTVLTYSDWAVDVLKAQSDKVNVKRSAPPSASEEFTPVADKSAHKAKMGMNPDWKIIGTVMRNQRRKLFPELFEAFGKYLKETGEKNTYLYCHTSYPDNGWDLPKYLIEHEVMSRVLFTYICGDGDCNSVGYSHFSDTVQPCAKCGNFSSKLTSVSSGASRSVLSDIYNLFDVYIQPASSEGFGIPIVEAAACGVPVMATDYSAMESEVRKLEGYPIKLRAKHLEMETGCDRALPDLDHTVEIWKELLNKPQPLRVQDGIKTRQAFEKHYGWDKTAKIWEEEVDQLSITDWGIEPEYGNPEAVPQEGINNKDFLDSLISITLNDPSQVNSYPFNKLLRDLNFGMFKNNAGGFFYGELSVFNREEYKPLTHQNISEMFKAKAENKNFWEHARMGHVNFKEEAWL
jgi:glycosyltransferase involved in cell wall biosynthesis